MRRKITTALLFQIELTNRHQVRSGTVLLPNFPRLEASRVVQAPVCSTPSNVQHGAVFSTVKYVQHSPVCSELFSTMQVRRSDRQLRRPSPLHCCLTPGRRIFSFQLNRNQISYQVTFLQVVKSDPYFANKIIFCKAIHSVNIKNSECFMLRRGSCIAKNSIPDDKLHTT